VQDRVVTQVELRKRATPTFFFEYQYYIQYTLDIRISSGGGVIFLYQIYSYVKCQGNY